MKKGSSRADRAEATVGATDAMEKKIVPEGTKKQKESVTVPMKSPATVECPAPVESSAPVSSVSPVG